MSITVQLDSFGKIKNWLKNLSISLKNVANATGRRVTNDSEQLAKERVRSPNMKPEKRTGAYLQSIESEFKGGTVSFLGTLKSDSSIAGIIEFGSRPHIIRPKGNKILFWPGAKHPAKEVQHPGTPEFRVLGDAVEAGIFKVDEKLAKEFKKHFKT